MSLYPSMDKKSYISFEKFVKDITIAENISVEKVTNDEILEKTEEIKKIHQGKHEGIVRGD